jgi:GNAT superfamily N-acetyltransferase
MTPSTVAFKRLSGAGIAPFVRDLARLRIDIFREYPYLYDGDEDYELNYLKTYVQSPRSLAMLVFDGDSLIGATTGLPMADETPEFQRAFLDRARDVRGIFYCGESVLRKHYRGRGIYRQLFLAREQHARALGGFDTAAFCCVQRPADHPLRPADYAPLDAVWRHFGYTEHPELHTEYVWKDVDEAQATAKRMRFWTKALA